MFKIEEGKSYLQVNNEGYITDCIKYNPQINNYFLYEGGDIPGDILNSCYKLVNNKIVLDKEKLELFEQEVLAEQKRIQEEFEKMSEENNVIDVSE
jgi:hypothetical protein